MSSRKTRYAKISTCFLTGIEGIPADIEVSISAGLPAFEIVGLCDLSIRESKERIRSVIRHAGYDFPTGRITAGFSPAYIHKSGSSFDLPLALCVLLASGQIHTSIKGQILAFGELTLTGKIRNVPGSIPRLCCARDSDIKEILVPLSAVREARLLNLRVTGVPDLKSAIQYLEGRIPDRNSADAWVSAEDDIGDGKIPGIPAEEPLDFSLLKGQEKTGRAILLSAAGFHSLLMTGSPGTGKTTAARILQDILPPLDPKEKLDILRLKSVIRILEEDDLLSDRRPFRYVHHTCTAAAMAGGGANPTPGELSLSLHGVLFLDEIAEFTGRVIDLLRQPLEEDGILISRAGSKVRFPTQFILVAAMNPCRCGKLLDDPKACTCSDRQRRQYMNRISGPLLDRIDLFTELGRIDTDALRESVDGTNLHMSGEMRELVAACWQRQYERCDETGQTRILNGMNRTASLTDSFRITRQAADSAVCFADKLNLSARGLNRMLKVARTIADLEGEKDVTMDHVSEALQFRHKMS
jgi:magnesium chelatase family protein